MYDYIYRLHHSIICINRILLAGVRPFVTIYDVSPIICSSVLLTPAACNDKRLHFGLVSIQSVCLLVHLSAPAFLLALSYTTCTQS